MLRHHRYVYRTFSKCTKIELKFGIVYHIFKQYCSNFRVYENSLELNIHLNSYVCANDLRLVGQGFPQDIMPA